MIRGRGTGPSASSIRNGDRRADRIRAVAAEGRKPVIWGAGSKAVSLLTTCGIEREVEYLVDVNPHKAGKFLPGTGHAVVDPDFLRQYRSGVVVAMNPVYVGEIRDRLAH